MRDDEVEDWDVLGKAVRAYRDGNAGPMLDYGMSIVYYIIAAGFFVLFMWYVLSAY